MIIHSLQKDGCEINFSVEGNVVTTRTFLDGNLLTLTGTVYEIERARNHYKCLIKEGFKKVV
jgi:hypothetical protein